MCCRLPGVYVQSTPGKDVVLGPTNDQSRRNENGISYEQLWCTKRQRPGSGTLDVECLHSGPTQVYNSVSKGSGRK